MLAGIWEPENSKTRGLDTYALLTTEPNEKVAPVCDRMAVVLPRDSLDAWMAEGTAIETLQVLTATCPPHWLTTEDAGESASRRSRSGASMATHH